MEKEIDGVKVRYEKLNQWWVLLQFGGISYGGIVYARDIDNVSERFLRHEYIHLMQQKELGMRKFLALYVWYWVINLFSWNPAYMSIPFEKEAYANQRVSGYLNYRTPFAWKNY